MAQLSDTGFINDANLISYYKCENINDSKGANTLTNNNSVIFDGSKYINGANFGTTNTNKSLTIDSTIGIDGGSISMIGWVKLNTEITSGQYGITGQEGTPSYVANEMIYKYNSGTPQITFVRTKLNVGGDVININITLGTLSYYHLAYTYDNANIIGYINGIAQGTTAATGNGGSSFGHRAFTIGALHDHSNNFTFDSFASIMVDDLAIFNRALTATEVQALYNDTYLSTHSKSWGA